MIRCSHLSPPPYRMVTAWLCMLVFAAVTHSVAGGWKRIGFPGKEIRVLAVGNDLMRNRKVVFTPVNDSGVYMVSGPDDSMYLFPYYEPYDQPAGKIRSLLVAEGGATVLAGSDSGLYTASLYSSALPMWRKTSFDSTKTVLGIAKSDSVYCVVTASEVFRAKSSYGTWWPCSSGSGPLKPPDGSVFTSITTWPVGYNFMIGTASALGDGSGGSVFSGSMDGRSWADNQCFPECTCIDGDVWSLAVDSQITVYAGTSKGVLHAVDLDTGCWHSRTPQLEMPIWDMCFARLKTPAAPPDIYAATDSGVYLKSIQRTASGAWNRLFTMKTFAVEVLEVSGEYIIYAGTADGLWKYDKSTSVTGMRKRVLPQTGVARTVMYSIDGKVVPQHIRKRYRGVYITVSGNRFYSGIAGMFPNRR